MKIPGRNFRKELQLGLTRRVSVGLGSAVHHAQTLSHTTLEALTVAAAASTALACVLLIAGCVASVLVGAALAAQRALERSVTLGALVQAHARVQH